MNRFALAMVFVGGLATACGGSKPADTATPTAEGGAARLAAVSLTCDGETFRVAFEEQRAVLVGADGDNTELPMLDPAPDSAGGAKVFTNGVLTFTRGGTGDADATYRFARGRMAFQDCTAAKT